MLGTHRLVASALVLGLIGGPAGAQAPWPTKTVTVIVPFAAGGNTDVLARIFAQRLQDRLGQPFVIENRSGAGSTTGIAAMVKAAPDGYTIGLGTPAGLAIAPHIYKQKLTYDIHKDVLPLMIVATQPNVLVVHPSIPANTVPELIAHLKAKPDALSYGSSGIGTTQHLCMELIVQLTGVKVGHVPYRASNQIMQDLIAGHVKMTCDTFTTAYEQVKAGNVRALAVTSSARYHVVPEVPTISETFAGFELLNWWAYMAPSGLPKDIADKLIAELTAIGKEPDTAKKLNDLGATASNLAGADAAAFVKADYAKWGPIIDKAGIKQP